MDLDEVVDEEAGDAEHHQGYDENLSLLVMLSDPVSFFTAFYSMGFPHRERHVVHDWNVRECSDQKHVCRESRKDYAVQHLDHVGASQDEELPDLVPAWNRLTFQDQVE